MNDLARRIGEMIRREGAISIERYWNMALYDPDGGYYTSRHPFGREGDFVTAPEISQMFGELIGAWVLAAWRGLGRPDPFVFAEIGPGRGTLMADMLRTIRALDAACLKAARIRLVETSDRLAAEQLRMLERFDLPIVRLRRIEQAEPHPLVLVGNELFDAVAIRQFVHDGTLWRERCISVGNSGRFAHVLCKGEAEAALPPKALAGLPPPAAGAVLELSPAREGLAGAVAARLARFGGVALFIDYGHAASAYGGTLQAIHSHSFADPLDRPGECDITSHVDFARIAGVFRRAGLTVSPLAEQGEFLMRLGLIERAGALGSGLDAAGRAAIEAAVRRLAGRGEKQMGRLFKALAAASQPLDLPPFA